MASTSPTAADTGREGKEGAGPAAEESKSASGSGSAKGPFDDLFSLELSHVRQRLEVSSCLPPKPDVALSGNVFIHVFLTLCCLSGN